MWQNVLPSWRSVSFSGRILLHIVSNSYRVPRNEKRISELCPECQTVHSHRSIIPPTHSDVKCNTYKLYVSLLFRACISSMMPLIMPHNVLSHQTSYIQNPVVLSSWLRLQAIRKLGSIPLTCFLAFRLVALITAGNWCEAECRFTGVGLGGLVLWLRYISGLSDPRTLLHVRIWHRGRSGWNHGWIHTRTVPSSWRHLHNYVVLCIEAI